MDNFRDMKIKFFVLAFLTAFLSFSQQLAFPDAKGAGAYVTGGRGGQVIYVTTLDWDAAGGLKEAIQTTGPRIVVFAVSGVIDATGQGGFSDVINGSSFNDISIFGQHAPLGGITILTSEFRFRDLDNVIISNIRFRRTTDPLTGPYSQDAVWFMETENVNINYCTFSHGNDEAVSAASSVETKSMNNFTFQNCFIQNSKTGMIVGIMDGVDVNNDGVYESYTALNDSISVINNVFTGISHRFPNHKGGGQVDIIGNIVYNWQQRTVRVGDLGTYLGKANIVNNYYKGAAGGMHNQGWFSNYNIPTTRLYRAQLRDDSPGKIHVSGTYIFGMRETPQADDRDLFSVFDGSRLTGVSIGDPVPDSFFDSSAYTFHGPNFTPLSAEDYYTDLVVNGNVGAYWTLDENGAHIQYRDTRDTELLQEIIDDSFVSANPGGTGFKYEALGNIPYPIIPENTRPAEFDTDEDGMPNAYETANGFDPNNALDGQIVSGNGYTNFENYLYSNTATTNVTGISIDQSGPIELTVGQTVDLDYTIAPVTATDQTAVWSRNSTSSVTVDQNGLVTAFAPGTTTITVTSNDMGFTSSIVINVVESEDNSGVNKKTKVLIISNNQ